jgi:hypothetical protein
MVQDIMGDICLLVDRCRRCNDHKSSHNNDKNHVITTGTFTSNATGTGAATDGGNVSTRRDDRFVSWRIDAEERLLLGMDQSSSSISGRGDGVGYGHEALTGLTGSAGMWHKGSDSKEADHSEWLRAKEEAKAVDALDSLMACFKGKQPLPCLVLFLMSLHP